MDELERYLYEVSKVQQNVNLYDELFCKDENRGVINKFNSHIFSIFQRAMNFEIIMSVASLFDGKSYKRGVEEHEYLTQYNLVSKYSHHLDGKLNQYREKTTKYWKDINIKDYRDVWLAHNDHAHMLAKKKTSHNVSTDLLNDLLNVSYALIEGIRIKEYNIQPDQRIVRLSRYLGSQSGDYFIQQLEELNK